MDSRPVCRSHCQHGAADAGSLQDRERAQHQGLPDSSVAVFGIDSDRDNLRVLGFNAGDHVTDDALGVFCDEEQITTAVG